MILDGGNCQNGARAGELYVDRFHAERELVGKASWNEDWSDMPQRWLAIMHVANYGATVPRRRINRKQRERK